MLTPCQAEIHKTKLDNELSQNRTNKVLMSDMLLRLIVCEIYHYKNTFKIYDSLETTEIFFSSIYGYWLNSNYDFKLYDI